MKYSFMTFSCPALTWDEVLARAAEFGYDGVEPRTDSKHGHGIEVAMDVQQRQDVQKKAADAGVAIACLAVSCRYADPETIEQNVSDTLDRIDLAADIGAPCMRVFGGAFPESITREKAAELLVTALRRLARRADARGVTVCMETHDYWTNPEHLAGVIGEVDSPSIAVNWDIMHPVRQSGWTIEDSFKTLRPWIRHLHVHDGKWDDSGNNLVPIGEGMVDHRKAIELLAADGYEGFLSGEWIGWDDPWETHLPRELATMKRFEAQARS